MATRFPAFQFYPNEWLSSGTRKKMTLEAQGAYMNLLATYWSENCKGLPVNTSELGKLAEINGTDEQVCAVLSQITATCFKEINGVLHNAKLRRKYLETVKHSRLMTLMGKKGAKRRWGGHAGANAQAMPGDSSSVFSLQSSSSEEDKKEKKEGSPPVVSENGFSGVLKAFWFCRTPQRSTKLAHFEDLERQGVSKEQMTASATDPTRRTWDFFEHIKALRPKHAAQSEMSKQLDAWVAGETRGKP